VNAVVPRGYGPIAKLLHWLVALLLAAQFVVSWFMPHIGGKTQPGTLVNLHFSFGVTILVLMAARLAYRLAHPVALFTPPGSPAWEPRVARGGHILFYFILLIGPFLGWASASAHNLPVNVFGLFALPAIAQPKAHWASVAGDVHTYAMWTLLGLVVLHAAAALYHHFVRHDTVLRRMLPGRA
jgi:cytochrome b561